MYNSLPVALIAVGKAIRRELWATFVKDNLDDHEDRINSIEGSSSSIQVFNEEIYSASAAAGITAFLEWRAPFSFNLLDAKIGIKEINSRTGPLEIDIRKSSDGDESIATTVFTTKPSVNYSTASAFDESTNVILDNAAKAVSEGDYLFFDITATPTGVVVSKFNLFLIGEPT